MVWAKRARLTEFPIRGVVELENFMVNSKEVYFHPRNFSFAELGVDKFLVDCDGRGMVSLWRAI